MFNIFLPKTVAKSSEVNQNFIYLRDKPFIIANSENTSISFNANHWDLAISTSALAALGDLVADDICDLISIKTEESIYVGGILMVGKITSVLNKTITFYKVNDLSTPITLSETKGIQIIYPIHSTFDKMPETVFKTEFVNSFEVAPKWEIENHSAECNSSKTIFDLNYSPLQNSVLIVRDGLTMLPNSGSNDYVIDYVNKTVTCADAPATGSTLLFQYQYSAFEQV